MAACLSLKAVLQSVSHGSACHFLRLTSMRQLSFLATQQGRNRTLGDQSQLTCLVPAPHKRQEMTFSKKRRKFVPRHEQDGVSPDMALVYDNNMNRFNWWGQLTINTLALPVYGLSLKIIATSNLTLQDMSITSGPLTAMAYIVVYSALLFGVNGLCRRSVHRMYTDANATNFAAVVQDWKMMKQTVHFDLSAVEKKTHHKVYGAFFGNLKIMGRSYLMTPTDFVLPKFYNLMMGYNLHRSIDMIEDLDVKDIMRGPPRNLKKPPKMGG